MAEEDPAKEDRPGAGAEEVGRQADRRGHRGDPVETIDHTKEGECGQVVRIGQVQQGQPPQPIVGG
jgi:hypothetical protein